MFAESNPACHKSRPHCKLPYSAQTTKTGTTKTRTTISSSTPFHRIHTATGVTYSIAVIVGGDIGGGDGAVVVAVAAAKRFALPPNTRPCSVFRFRHGA